MEECTHRKRMPPVPAKVNGHDSRTEKGIKSQIKLDLPFIVPDLVHKFKIICLRET